MSVQIDSQATARTLRKPVERMFELSAAKIRLLEKSWSAGRGSPVFTRQGRYTSRGWTEWTEGFQYGSALIQFEASNDPQFLELGRRRTRERMAAHVSHTGVHDHGFNNISTYGNLLRLALSGRIDASGHELDFWKLALKASGAIQAARWTEVREGGFIYSFNGPHSLFIDTMRSLRSLAAGHLLGHRLMGEHDEAISLLERLVTHAQTTARFSIYYGEDRDAYDVPGRTAHESIFNVKDGLYRCPNSQQGFSPFTTWTRGLAWAICGFAEQLQWIQSLPASDFPSAEARREAKKMMERAARATADFYLRETPSCGIPYWDTGAPGLSKMGDYLNRAADPFNEFEPVDSSAAAIAAQGFLRLGLALGSAAGARYRQAGFSIAQTLLKDPYLSSSTRHEGLLLHSIYHRPNGWDHVPAGRKIPCGESSMWGDYHLRELGLMILQMESTGEAFRFFDHL